MHNYEITKIELLSPIASTRQKAYTAVDNNSITLANLLQNVEFSYEKGRKILDEMQNNADASDNDILYRVEDDPEELKKLEMEPKVKVYRAMQLIDGKLYPPMAAKVNGSLVEPAEPGQWLRADEHPELAKMDCSRLTREARMHPVSALDQYQQHTTHIGILHARH